MKKKVILTESDIRNLVVESLLEYYAQNGTDENKTTNLVAALLATGGSMFGINCPVNTPSQEKTQQVNIASESDIDNSNTAHYTKEYYPSDKLIDFIKSYETFHEGWIDDGSGNLTTGWGFKITPELKKRYPTGMHRDKHGNTPEADAYLIEYINNHLELFKRCTPNLDKLPQEYADALFDVFYNVGAKIYQNSPNLQKALRNLDFAQIANNLQYGRLRGHKLRSMDRKNILNGIYQRS